VVSGASISTISISLDGRKIQKSCFLVNVIVDGKQSSSLKDKYSTVLTDPPWRKLWRAAGGEWGENEKDWIETSEKKMAAASVLIVWVEQVCFLYFSTPKKRNLVHY